MTRPVLLDTGPLVAILLRRDEFHEWTRQQWALVEPPLLTCEAVLTEVTFLLARSGQDTCDALEPLRRGVIQIGMRLDEEIETVLTLVQRYRDVPMSLADACLVRMSELFPERAVFTLDSDFHIYRKHRRERISVVSPARRT